MSQAFAAAATDVDPAPDHDVRAVLRLDTFRRLWLALGLSSLGDWLGLLATAAMAGSLAGQSYAAQNLAVAVVFILRLTPAIILGPFAGAVADRLDRRWTMVIGDLLRFGLFASIVIVGTLPWLFIATVLIECVALFWGPANDATIPNLVPRRRLEAANQLSLVATFGTAPVAAGLFAVLSVVADLVSATPGLPDVKPFTLALWANALTFLVSALVIARLRFPVSAAPAATRGRGLVHTIIDGWRFVARTRMIRGLVLGMLGAFGAGGLVVGLGWTFARDLGGGDAGFGVLFGAVFVGLALGMWVGPRILRGFSRTRLFGVSLVAGGIALVALALSQELVLAVMFTLVVGLCGGVPWVIGQTLIGLEAQDEVRGRTFAFLQSAARVVMVVALAAGPAVAGQIGVHSIPLPWGGRLNYNGAAWVMAIAGLLAVVMGLVAYRQMDDRRGTGLRSDLVQSWQGRPDAPRPAVRGHNGYFIAFEGGDGSGKSTQARLLADWLRGDQGHDVVLTREPGATAVGVRLREILLGEGEAVRPRAEALLFAADRAHHVDSLVRPALGRGAVVITDRYVDSSIAYQGAGRALEVEEIDFISRWATGGLVPDLVVLLDVPEEIARVRRANDPRRDGADKLESQSEDFHSRVRSGFLELARREPGRYLVLDGSDPREEIQEAIRARVRNIVPISRTRRAELAARLAAEEDARKRRAAAEAEVLRLDAELRGRSRDEARERQEARRRAREEAERQLQEEAERQLREEARLAAEAQAGAEIVAALAQPVPEASAEEPAPGPQPGSDSGSDSGFDPAPDPDPDRSLDPDLSLDPDRSLDPRPRPPAALHDGVEPESQAVASRRTGRHAGGHALTLPSRPWFSADPVTEELPRLNGHPAEFPAPTDGGDPPADLGDELSGERGAR